MTNEKINQEELSTLRLWAKEWVLSGLYWAIPMSVDDYVFNNQGAAAATRLALGRVGKKDDGWHFYVHDYNGFAPKEVLSDIGPLPLEDALNMLSEWIRENK